MKTRLWFSFLFVSTLLILTTPKYSSAEVSSAPIKSPIATSTIISLTNKDRETLGLKTLINNPTLEKAAQLKAEDMAKNGYFAHTSPEGKNPWYWFKKVGYLFSYAGENLAVKFSTAEDVERGWMNSPTHKANIVNKNYSEVGIGIAYGTYKGEQTIFVVQLFGTSVSKIVAVKH